MTIPAHLERDELEEVLALLRTWSKMLGGPGRRALSKLSLTHELATLAPSLGRTTAVGTIYGEHEGGGRIHLEPEDGYAYGLEALAREAGARPEPSEPWRLGRFRVTLERLPEVPR